MKKLQPGIWLIDSPIEEGVGVIAHRRARNLAIAATFTDINDRALLESAASRRESICALVVHRTGLAVVIEGKSMLWGGQKLVLLKKGSLHKGFDWDELKPTTWIFGPDKQGALEHTWGLHAGWVPELAEPSISDIPVYDGSDQQKTIAAVFLMQHPGFEDGELETAGCLFLATDVQPPEDGNDGIVNGYLWAPADSGLYSEHGSAYYQDLRVSSGRVLGYRPGSLSFADCLAGRIPGQRRAAYAMVLGKVSASR